MTLRMLLAKNAPAENTRLRRVDRIATVAQREEYLIQVELDVSIASQVNFDPLLQAVANLAQVVPIVLLVPTSAFQVVRSVRSVAIIQLAIRVRKVPSTIKKVKLVVNLARQQNTTTNSSKQLVLLAKVALPTVPLLHMIKAIVVVQTTIRCTRNKSQENVEMQVKVVLMVGI
jgi:hypothetical protein